METEDDNLADNQDDSQSQLDEDDQAARDRIGSSMEVQGCDPEVCDMLCGICPWEPCIVECDNGRTCDVRVCSDGAVCKDVANRFLRMPAAAAGKRARRG
jgi:hypothetical protein